MANEKDQVVLMAGEKITSIDWGIGKIENIEPGRESITIRWDEDGIHVMSLETFWHKWNRGYIEPVSPMDHILHDEVKNQNGKQ